MKRTIVISIIIQYFTNGVGQGLSHAESVPASVSLSERITKGIMDTQAATRNVMMPLSKSSGQR